MGETKIKKHGYIVLDTETAPLVNHQDGKAHPEDSLVYDLGYVVVLDGSIVESRSFAIADTFGKPEVMTSAYYASKLPQYYAGATLDGKGLWTSTSFVKAWTQFKQDVKIYHVKDVWAFNCLFDVKALNSTIRYFSNGYQKYFVPYGVRVRDVWDYASCITATPSYCRYVKKHGYFTKAGNPVTNAEIVYRYITKDNDFAERHTALEDAKVEAKILEVARKRHSKKRQSVGQGWRDASKLYKSRDNWD